MGHPGTVNSSELLERSQQLSSLRTGLAAVIDDARGRMVLVRGEAGIGKTALLREFCGAQSRPTRILWSSCDPLFTPRPLGPLLDLARVTSGELQERLDAGARPHDVALALLRELEMPAPSVLVIEDIHWADEATLDVVRLLAGRIESVPTVFLVTYRDDELHRTHPLRLVLGELPSGEVVTRMELTGLSRDAVAVLAEASTIDADELHTRSGGNPFFVTEALAAETERIPATVRDAVLARAARLSSAGRRLLDGVSVVPQRVEVWLLEALAESALDALDECLSSGILRSEVDGVVFRHELARLAIEDTLSPDRALALHRRALQALSEKAIGSPDFARLAHHAEGAGDTEAVLRYAPAAAEQAVSLGSPREAQNQYGRALRFAGGLDPAVRADLLERFGEVGYLTDMRDEAVDALSQAIEIFRSRDEVLRHGDALRLRARLHACAGRVTQARSDLRDAVSVLEHAPAGPELARAYATLAGVSMIEGQLAETMRFGEQALELAQSASDVEALVTSLNNMGVVQLLQADLRGREMLERSLSLALAHGLDQDAGRAYINLAYAHGQLSLWQHADRYVSEGVRFCREHGLEAWLQCLVAIKAESELIQGDWDAAAETATSILAAPPDAVSGPVFDAQRVLGTLRARRGDPDYWPLLDQAKAAAEKVGELDYVGSIAVARAEAAWLEGRSKAVGPETEHAFALALERDAPAYRGSLAVWRWRADLATTTLPEQIDDAYRLQLAGNPESAAELWFERGCSYDGALALALSTDPANLRRALGVLQELGARPAAAIVTRRLRQLGERQLRAGPRRRTRQNPAGLTQRQLEVLALLVQGLRNAEIAERLVVAEKTVDHHVSAILGKLDARTRGEAAAIAARLGLRT